MNELSTKGIVKVVKLKTNLENVGFEKECISSYFCQICQNCDCVHFWGSVLLATNNGVKFLNCSEASQIFSRLAGFLSHSGKDLHKTPSE